MGVAPMLWAQEPAVLPLTVETAPVIAQPQVQAETLSALGLLPQDTEAFAAIGNLPGFLHLAGVPAEVAGEAAMIDSAAIGLGAGSAASLHAALPLLNLLLNEESDVEMAKQWAAHAHQLSAAHIARQWEQHRQEGIDQAIASLAQWRLAPVTMVLTLKAEAKDKLPELYAQLLEELRSEKGAETVECGDWKGVRLNAPENIAEAVELTALQKVQLREALNKTSVSVLCAVRERSLVLSVCSNPADAQSAVSPVSSVLAGEKVSFLQAAPKPLMALYLPAELQNECREMQMLPLRRLGGFATSVFKTMAAEDAPAAKAYQGAVNAVAMLQAQAEMCSPSVDAPTTMLVWEDGNLHIDCCTDANGQRFAPAEGLTLPQGTAPIFCYESDPVQGRPVFCAADVLKACEALAEGTAETLNNEEREMTQAALMQYRLFSAEQETLGKAFAAWNNAFSGKVVLWADGQGSVPASLLGGSPAQMTAFPRVAVAAGLRNRAELENGRMLFLQALHQGMQKMDMDPAATENLPVLTSQDGDVSLHTLLLPFCCPGFSPSVAVTEKTWVLSSSAEQGGQFAKAAPTPPAAEGKASFRFYFRPLADLLQKMYADAPADSPKAETVRQAAMFADAVQDISGIMTTTPDDILHLRVDVTIPR